MRKNIFITLFSLTVLALGAYIYITEPFNPERRVVQELTKAFMEDIQFKDFHSSALYHHELEQDRVDIGKAIERLFLIDPEMLDIQDFEIVRTEIDTTARRARTLVRTRARRLNIDDDPQEKDLQLFWLLRHPQCPLGSTCAQGICVDGQDRPVMQKPDEDKKNNKDSDEEPVERPYTCDEELPLAWFMNLDSTLKSRDYR